MPKAATRPIGTRSLRGRYKFKTPQEAYTNAQSQIARTGQQRILDLSRYGLDRLPPEIAQLTTLQSLHLNGNRFTALPPEITHLTALQSLHLNGNQLTALPPEIAHLTALRILDLNGNRLIELPSEIAHLTALQSLHLNGNQLIALPPEIGHLTALEEIFLGRNLLTTLLPEIAHLTALQSLDLDGNQLTALPPEMAQLTTLKTLDLDNNQLSVLPAAIAQLTALKFLYLAGNRLPHPYARLIAPGQPEATRNVLAYLRGELDIEALAPLVDAPETPTSKRMPKPRQTAASNKDVLIHGDHDEAPLGASIEQRPAAFHFGVRNGRIDALPERAKIINDEFAFDTYTELVTKTQTLLLRINQTNSDQGLRAAVERLQAALGTSFQDVLSGVLLSASRSVEADRNAFDNDEGRQELSPDVIALMDDALWSLQDLLAVFPVVRRIEVERLALAIERNPTSIAAITKESDVVKAIAARSVAVTEDAVNALRKNDASIEEARNLDVKAALVADHLLVLRNFVSVVITVLKEVGGDSWRAVKANLPDGVADAARLAPLVALGMIAASIAGPIAGIASAVPAFVKIAKSLKTLRKIDKPHP